MRNIKPICIATLIAGSALTVTACSSDHVAQSGEATVESVTTSESTTTQELPTEVTWNTLMYSTLSYGDAYISPDGKFHKDLSEMEKIDPKEKFPIGETVENVVFYQPGDGNQDPGSYNDECSVTPTLSKSGELNAEIDCHSN